MSETNTLKRENKELRETIKHLEQQLYAVYKEKDGDSDGELTTAYQTKLSSNEE